jgi:hypothetical protein
MAISFLCLQLSFEKSSKSSTAISICHVCTLVVTWWSCMNDHFFLFSAGFFSICHIKQCDDLSQLHCLGHRDQAHLTVEGLVQRQSSTFSFRRSHWPPKFLAFYMLCIFIYICHCIGITSSFASFHVERDFPDLCNFFNDFVLWSFPVALNSLVVW